MYMRCEQYSGAGTLYMYNCFNALHKVKSMTQIHDTDSQCSSLSQPARDSHCQQMDHRGHTSSGMDTAQRPPTFFSPVRPSDKYTHDSRHSSIRRHSLRSTT
jgi:hypothetical protein